MRSILIAAAIFTIGCGPGDDDDAEVLPGTVNLSYDTDQVASLDGGVNACSVTPGGVAFKTSSVSDKELVQLQWDVSWITDTDTSMVDFTPLQNKGTIADFVMVAGGAFDLEDATDNNMSLLTTEPQTCSMTAEWIQTDGEWGPGKFNQRYKISFECPTLNYINIDRDDSSDQGAGTLTNLRGDYLCWIADAP